MSFEGPTRTNDDGASPGTSEQQVVPVGHRRRRSSLKPLSKKAMDKFNGDQSRKGVVYLSRIPPYMQPQKIRHLLGEYGEIQRIYLAPEGRWFVLNCLKAGR